MCLQVVYIKQPLGFSDYKRGDFQTYSDERCDQHINKQIQQV